MPLWDIQSKPDSQIASLGPVFEKDLVRAELKAMRRRIFLVRKALFNLVKQQEGPSYFFLRPRDEQRLLIFSTWAERYRVPLRYVLERVIGYWQGRTKRNKRGTKKVLGARLTTLTSPKTELILQGLIQQDYPAEENQADWQQHERERLLGLAEPRGRAKPLFGVNSFSEAILYYDRKIQRRRRKLDKAAAGQWRRRRRWRGNPWL